jgi:PEP-CTERM motif
VCDLSYKKPYWYYCFSWSIEKKRIFKTCLTLYFESSTASQHRKNFSCGRPKGFYMENISELLASKPKKTRFQMRKTIWRMLIAPAAVLCIMGLSTRADATMITAICNDLACGGGDDFLVIDNAALDTISLTGATSFSTAAFGYSLLVNTAQSKPILGSATAPQFDITFTATTGSAAGGNVFLYVTDTDFLGAQSFVLNLGGTNSGGSGTETGRAWGGTSNTALQFSGANLLGAVGPLSGSAFANAVAGSFTPAVSPYSLTIGVAINRTTAGTSTGDLNFAAVPEPGSVTLFSLGLIGLGFGAYRRKTKNA